MTSEVASVAVRMRQFGNTGDLSVRNRKEPIAAGRSISYIRPRLWGTKDVRMVPTPLGMPRFTRNDDIVL